jgi:hypothetical protein
VEALDVDFDGDGTFEVADAREEDLGHAYDTPGTYPAKIRVRLAGGETSTVDAPVSVLTPAAFESELQGRWSAMKEAVRAGQPREALECVFSMTRSSRIQQLLAGIPRDRVEEYLPPIRFARLTVMEAHYESVRPIPGATRPMEVRFQPDLDGEWRVLSILLEAEP